MKILEHSDFENNETNEPRASVSLSAKQWSAVLMAITHGVATVKDNKKLPIVVVNHFLRDIADSVEEIQARLQAEVDRRGKSL